MGWNLRTKLCCIAPETRNTSRDSLQGFHNSYIMLWIVMFWNVLVSVLRSQQLELEVCISNTYGIFHQSFKV